MVADYKLPLKVPRITAIVTSELHERGQAEAGMYMSRRARVLRKANTAAVLTDQDYAQQQPSQMAPAMMEELVESPFKTYVERQQREDEKMQKGHKWSKQPSRMSKQAWPPQSLEISVKPPISTYNADNAKDRGAARMGAYVPTREGICAENSPNEIMSMVIFTSAFIILLLGCVFVSTYPYDPQSEGHSVIADGMHCLKVCEMAAFANGSLEAPRSHNLSSGCCTPITGETTQKLGTGMVSYRRALDRPIKNHDLPKGAALLGMLPVSNHRNNNFVIGLVNLSAAEHEHWKHFTVGWATCHVFPVDPWKYKCPALYSKGTDGAASHAISKSSIHSTSHQGSPVVNTMIVTVSSCAGDLEGFHVLLTAAKAVSQTKGDMETMPILVISDFCPVGTLFSRNELKEQKADLWLFHMNLDRLRQNLAKPVDFGACNLAP